MDALYSEEGSESKLQWDETILGLSETEACTLRLADLICGVYVTAVYFSSGIWWFGGLLTVVKLSSAVSFVVTLIPTTAVDRPQGQIEMYLLAGLFGAVPSSVIQLLVLALIALPETNPLLLWMAFALQLLSAAAVTNSAFLILYRFALPFPMFLGEREEFETAQARSHVELFLGEMEEFETAQARSHVEPLLPGRSSLIWRTADVASRVIFWIVPCLVLDAEARPFIPYIFVCELAACALYSKRCLEASVRETGRTMDESPVLFLLILCMCGMPWPCFPADLGAQLRLQLCTMLWRSNLVIFFSIMVVHRYTSVTQGRCPLAAEPVLETLMGVGLTMHLLAMLVVLIYQALLRTRCLCLFPTRAVFGDSRLHLAVSLGAENLLKELWTADDEEGSGRDRLLLHEAVLAGHVEVIHDQGVDVHTTRTNSGLALHAAAKAGKVDVLRALQNLGADMRSTDEDGSNAALLASQGGHGAALQFLLQARCDAEARNRRGTSAISAATEHGHASLLPMLLDARCDPQTAGRDGEPLILMAAGLQTTDSLHALLEARCDPKIATKGGDTPVLRAASNGHVGALKLLVEANCDPRIADEHGNTAIITAACKGHADALQFLSEARGDPNVANKSGGSAVISAVANEHVGVLELLLEARCDPTIADKDGVTPIITAAQGGSIDALELLLEVRCDPKIVNKTGRSAISFAAQKGHCDVLKLLLDARCDPASTDKDGVTPIITAAQGGSIDALELLLEVRCDPKIVNKNGCSAISFAAERGHCDMLKLLLKARCSPEIADKDGVTPVMDAAGCAHVDALKLLLEARCDATTVSKHGMTAILNAVSGEALELLLQARCEANSEIAFFGFTPVHLAACRGNVDALEVLLRARGDPQKTASKFGVGFSPAAAAAKGGHTEALKVLLRARCNPLAVDDFRGDTLVMIAAEEGRIDLLEFLLHKGCCDLRTRNKDGDTAVSLAAAAGEVRALRLLLDARCEPDRTAVEEARGVTAIQTEVVEWMVRLPEQESQLVLNSTEALTLAYQRPRLTERLRNLVNVQQPVLQKQLRGLAHLADDPYWDAYGVPSLARGSGMFYHEVELLTVGRNQLLGWLTTQFDASIGFCSEFPPRGPLSETVGICGSSPKP